MKILSYAVVLGSLLTKAPEIHRLVTTGKSSISADSLSLETLTNMTAIVYHFTRGFPVLFYAENIIIGGQNLALLWLLRAKRKLALVLSFTAASYALRPIVVGIQAGAVPLLLFSRVQQVRVNHARGMKHTSNLSVIPYVLSLFGCFVRLSTTITELKSDRIVLAGFISSMISNATIALQIMKARHYSVGESNKTV